MLPLTTINRCVAVFMLPMGLTAIACNRKTDAQPPQKAHATIDPNQIDYDEDGYPIDRNRKHGVGSTHLRADGLEELNIPLREEAPIFNTGIGSFDDLIGGYPIERRPAGIGSTRIHDDGKEELIIPLRERYFEDNPVMPREVKPQDRQR